MKILFVSDFFQPYAVGAANISTYLIAKKLAEKNSCYIITQKFTDQPWQYDGLPVYPLLPKYYAGTDIREILKTEFLSLIRFQNIPAYFRALSDYCKSKNIEVINVQSNNLGLLISLLLLNKPLVIDVRDYYFTCPFMLKTKKCDRHHLFCTPSYATKRKGVLANLAGQVYFRYQTFLYQTEKNLLLKPLLILRRKKCALVANSNYVRNMLKKEFTHTGIRMDVIHNPINTADYSVSPKSGPRKVLFASILEKSKGIWDCIYAFEKLKAVSLEIAGDGPETGSILNYLGTKNIKNIKMLGKLPYKDIPQAYRRAYITVQPSVWPEPFGRYILESFASATPLITTPTGGTPEAIKDRQTGLLVPPGDPGSLAKAVSELLSNHQLYNHIRANIITEAEKYHPDRIAGERTALYQSLLLAAV